MQLADPVLGTWCIIRTPSASFPYGYTFVCESGIEVVGIYLCDTGIKSFTMASQVRNTRRECRFPRDRRAIWRTSLKSLLHPRLTRPPREAIEPTFKLNPLKSQFCGPANLKNFPICHFLRISQDLGN